MQIIYQPAGSVTVATIRLDNGMDINLAIRDGKALILYPRAALSPANARLLAEALLAAARLAETAVNAGPTLTMPSKETVIIDDTVRLSQEELDSVRDKQRQQQDGTSEIAADTSPNAAGDSAL